VTRDLQRQGALRVAQPRGAEPLPPFHKWSFREMRYIQWLVDMHTVHYALEAALADAVTVAATEHYGALALVFAVFHAVRKGSCKCCSPFKWCKGSELANSGVWSL
jgi:hypothetical protein